MTKSIVKHYEGDLILRYDGDECYVAEITRCIVIDDYIILDYSGSDDGNKFKGDCKFIKSNMMYVGSGKEKSENSNLNINSLITTVIKEQEDLTLKGSFQYQGNNFAYDLTIELNVI